MDSDEIESILWLPTSSGSLNPAILQTEMSSVLPTLYRQTWILMWSISFWQLLKAVLLDDPHPKITRFSEQCPVKNQKVQLTGNQVYPDLTSI
jgi:hypothetical protein